MRHFIYRSTKTYTHNAGFSTAFRQWTADSHCKYLHGYALAFILEFGSDELDVRNWVVDFGGLKSLKTILENTFDHKTIVAGNDPHFDWFKEGHNRGVLDLVVLDHSGCEMFAEYVFGITSKWLVDAGFSPRCELISVEVSEHESNSAIYVNPNLWND
jgi:6-pyruvoyltetrahydropterin/6-carboxytetrahydropterin synthase